MRSCKGLAFIRCAPVVWGEIIHERIPLATMRRLFTPEQAAGCVRLSRFELRHVQFLQSGARLSVAAHCAAASVLVRLRVSRVSASRPTTTLDSCRRYPLPMQGVHNRTDTSYADWP